MVFIIWISFTLPDTPAASIKSPTLKGLNIRINIPDAKLERLFWRANPIASPSAPIAATNEFVGTPILPRAAIATIIRSRN